jgi:hypothetical protein
LRSRVASGAVSPEAADIIMHNQELAFNQTIRFTEYMTLVLAQKLLDTVFAVVGWAIYNRTGVNLFPALVTPKRAAE